MVPNLRTDKRQTGRLFDPLCRMGVLSIRLPHYAMAVLRRVTDRGLKEALRKQMETAKRHSIFGAPSRRTADGKLFWGNDRLEEALD